MINVNRSQLEEAFDILNLIVFEPEGFKIPLPQHLDISPLIDYLGFVMKIRISGEDYTMCILNDWFHDWEEFTEILAHEMIHVYQVMVLGTYGNHDEFFWSWESRLEKYGIPLREGEF